MQIYIFMQSPFPMRSIQFIELRTSRVQGKMTPSLCRAIPSSMDVKPTTRIGVRQHIQDPRYCSKD